MKKQILSIGKVLSRVEQKEVFGGSIYDEDEEGYVSIHTHNNLLVVHVIKILNALLINVEVDTEDILKNVIRQQIISE